MGQPFFFSGCELKWPEKWWPAVFIRGCLVTRWTSCLNRHNFRFFWRWKICGAPGKKSANVSLWSLWNFAAKLQALYSTGTAHAWAESFSVRHDLVATIVEWTRVSMKWYSLKWLQRLGGGHSPQTLFNFIIFARKHGWMRTVITFPWYHIKRFRFTLHQDDATYLVCHKRIMMVCHACMMRDSGLYSSQTIPSNRFLIVYTLQKGDIFQPGVRLPEVRCHHFSWRNAPWFVRELVGNFWNPLDLAAIKWE